MKLATASSGDVVRNSNNGSHYRFDRIEKSKARIRPLELFPTGRLVPKPTDTLVSVEIEVALIGRWHDGMTVEGHPTHNAPHYEAELVTQQARLVLLQAEYQTLPQNGVGKLSRGSFANKVKNCAARIEILRTGLGLNDTSPLCAKVMTQPMLSAALYQVGDFVQVPSGRPGLVLSNTGGSTATVRTTMNGAAFELPLPCEALRPWAEARLATV